MTPAPFLPGIEWRLLHESSLGDRVWTTTVVGAEAMLFEHGPEAQLIYRATHGAEWQGMHRLHGHQGQCLSWLKEQAEAECAAWMKATGHGRPREGKEADLRSGALILMSERGHKPTVAHESDAHYREVDCGHPVRWIPLPSLEVPS